MICLIVKVPMQLTLTFDEDLAGDLMLSARAWPGTQGLYVWCLGLMY